MGDSSATLGLASLLSSNPFLQPRLLLLLLLFLLVGAQEPPPNYSQDMLPDTNFTCSDKATGGYYADPEAGCQMFHVCVRVSDEEIRDFRFLCPNNTVFDQQNFICTNWWDIDCQRSTRYYSKNDLFRVDETTTEQEYEYEQTFSTYYEYVYEELEDPQARNNPDYEFEYYDGDDKHRNDNRARSRKGKSQDSSTTSTTTAAPTTTTSTTTTTTTTTTPKPTTTTTTTPRPTTTPQPTFRTTPRITTLRPSLHFSSGFRVGKPVVSVTSSTSIAHESTSADTRFSRFQSPTRFESSSTRTVRQETLNAEEVDELYDGVEDPFANYDWRRDASGVTASTKTRYEQRFGTNNRSRQTPSAFSISPRSQEETSTTLKNRKSLVDASESSNDEIPRENHGRYVSSRGSSRGPNNGRLRPSSPDSALEEFANFRYYKTAFGNTPSAPTSPTITPSSPGVRSPTSMSTSATSSPEDRSTSSVISTSSNVRVRPAGYISARSASRNTRYALYG